MLIGYSTLKDSWGLNKERATQVQVWKKVRMARLWASEEVNWSHRYWEIKFS